MTLGADTGAPILVRAVNAPARACGESKLAPPAQMVEAIITAVVKDV